VKPVVVVTYPHAVPLEVQRFKHDSVPDNAVGLAYYFRGGLIARGVVSDDALASIESLVSDPVHVALAAQEDDSGNIEGRLCLVLPMELGRELMEDDEAEDASEPWKASVPTPPTESDGYGTGGEDDEKPQMALLPIGNVVRSQSARNHPDDVSADAREMLVNLLTGGGEDAVKRAIDDLLDSI